MLASARRSMTSIDPYNIVKAPQRLLLNSTPLVRWYIILSNKWGAVHFLNSGVYRLFGTPFGIAKHPTC